MKKLTYLMCCLTLGSAAMIVAPKAKAQATDQDKQFLTKASAGNYEEIQLGKLAEQKASDPQVKAFGHRMVVDHTALGEKMKPFAEQWGLTPPTSLDQKGQATYDHLSGLSGKEFDKAYMDGMVRDHTQDLEDFTQEAQETREAKFKAAVEHGKTVIATHKKMAVSLQSKVG